MFASRGATALALASLCSVVMPGCGGEDGTSPGDADHYPVSPFELVAIYRSALQNMDYTAYASLVDANFKFIPMPEDAYLFPVSHLNQAEELQSAANIFSGQAITGCGGILRPGISSITVNVWEPLTDWFPIDASDPDFPSPLARGYGYQLSLARRSDSTLIVEGMQILYVKEDAGSSKGQPHYSLVGQREGSIYDKGSIDATLGQVKVAYLTSLPPDPVCTASVVGGYLGRRFEFDACSSSDPEGRPCLFRWLFEPSGSWTSWAQACQVEHTFSTYGQRQVRVEVSDPWGYASQGSLLVDVEYVNSLPFPDTPDKVIENLRSAYERMDIDVYRPILHPTFRFMFQQFDIDNLILPSDHFTREEDLESTTNLFSGNPVNGVPGVSQITWPILSGTGVWEDSTNPDFPDSRRRLYNLEMNITRPGATTIIVRGQQEFYVASRDSVHNGVPTQFWQMLGQIDLTDTSPKQSNQSTSWGEVKCLYR